MKADNNIQNFDRDEKENGFAKAYIHLTPISPIGFCYPAGNVLLHKKMPLSKYPVCAIMPPICNINCASPITIIITTMTISQSLGEALPVKKSVLRGNQSPNATAKGDLFCQDLNTKGTKSTKEYLKKVFLLCYRSNLRVLRVRSVLKIGGAQCTKLIRVVN